MTTPQDAVPGSALGLPERGAGSLASWGSRIAALVIDWCAAMAVAMLLFGPGVLGEGGWRRWAILGVFFVEKALLTALTGGSFGQLLRGIGVIRVDGGRLGWWRPIVRTALICLALPALLIGADRRSITDLGLGAAVVNRRPAVN